MLHMIDGLTEEQRAFGRAEAIRSMAEVALTELEADQRYHSDIFPSDLSVWPQAGVESRGTGDPRRR